MAWSEAYILSRAQSFVRIYADETQLTITDVRSAFQEFAHQTRAFTVSESFTTVANQKVYALSRVLFPVKVRYGADELVLGRLPNRFSYRVENSRLILNFEPAPNVNLWVEGYGIPAAIDGLDLQPEGMLQDAVAYLSASRFLSRYGDPQAVSRATVYYGYYQSAVVELRKQRLQHSFERCERMVRRRYLRIG
jgi:hypothetical protein